MVKQIENKKTILTLESDCNYTVIGISYHSADYKFIHFLNKIKNFSFIRLEEFEIQVKSIENSLKFPLYYFDDEENYVTYYFISNRSEDGFLIQEWKNFDYLLISKEKLSESILRSLMAEIKKIQGVLLLSELKDSKKTDFEILLSDIELNILTHNAKNSNLK